MATGMDYSELERSRNELLRQVQRLQESAVSLQRDLAAARHYARKHRQAKNQANRRTRAARLQARFWKDVANNRTAQLAKHIEDELARQVECNVTRRRFASLIERFAGIFCRGLA